MLCMMQPSFTPKIDFASYPVISAITDAMQSMYVERAGSQEARDRIVQQFIDRQNAIEVDKAGFAPLLIFAESTTTNGTHI